MIRRPPRSTPLYSSAASDVYKRQNVKSGLEIVPVRWIDKVLEVALESKPVPLTDEEVAVAAAAVAVSTDKAAASSAAVDGLKH